MRSRIGGVRVSSHFKAFTLLLLVCLFNCRTLSQRLKIDSLKNSLSLLKDTERVDCLNTLSLVYTYLNVDSAESFADAAYKSASQKNYIRGIVMSMNNKAHIAGFARHNFPSQEMISLHTIELYKDIPADVLQSSYMNLAIALFCQSHFDRSEETCKTMLQVAQKFDDKKQLGEVAGVLGCIYFETGDYENSFQYFNQSLNLFTSISDAYNTSILLIKIGDFYQLAGDQKTALDYYYKSLSFSKGPSLDWHPLEDLGNTYYALDQYDSVFNERNKYLQTIKYLTVRSDYATFPKIIAAEKHISSKNYDEALRLLNENLKIAVYNNDNNQEMRSVFDIAKVYVGKKDFQKAFQYAKLLLVDAQQYKARQYLRDSYYLLYSLFDQLNRADSALTYYRRFTEMKDYVALSDFNKRMAMYEAATETEKKKVQIEMLNNQQLISQQKLQLDKVQLRSTSLQKNLLLAGVIILLLLGFIVFRNISLKRKNEAHRREIVEKELSLQKVESERTRIELQQKASELEMQALRAQMNPHFIFNCLNSINRFTIANEPAKAADYLTKFAKLIRIVLQTSGQPFIPLNEEIYSLQLYMDLEAIRFQSPFNYSIDPGDINTSIVLLPPLLLQPFVENAIWHGLHPRKSPDCKITIEMSLHNDALHCTISDNGVGRNHQAVHTAEGDLEKKSLGIKLTRRRLELLESSQEANEPGITIDDLIDEGGRAIGTRVNLKIPVKSV